MTKQRYEKEQDRYVRPSVEDLDHPFPVLLDPQFELTCPFCQQVRHFLVILYRPDDGVVRSTD